MSAEKDYLECDTYILPGHNYALISIVSPTSNQKSNVMALKVRGGMFATVEEANNMAKKLSKMEGSLYDIYVVQTGAWLPIPPDNDKIQNQEYQEKGLNDLIKGYQESQIQAKEQFEQRKVAVMRDGLDAHLSPEEKLVQVKSEVAEKFESIQESIHRVEGEASGSGSAST
jgi:Family of unknown function (DUF5832)